MNTINILKTCQIVWVYQPGYKDEQCDLCNGQGYTRDKYQPKVKVINDGWEKVDEE